MTRITKFMILMLMMVVLCYQGKLSVSAANTVFCSPTISPDVQPKNMVYQSPNLNILADVWSYGLDGYIVNTSNLDDLIYELVANVSTSGGVRANVSIYPNGANLSDSNVSALQDAGWDELSLYYYDFFLIGGMPENGLSPNVAVTDSAEIAMVLDGIGNMDEKAVINIEGVNMSPLNMGLYSNDLAFLHTDFYAYKYIADVKKFVPIVESYIDSYDANVLEMYDLQNIESDVNGLYIVMNSELPAELVTTSEELPILRQNVKQEETVPVVKEPLIAESEQEMAKLPSVETQEKPSEPIPNEPISNEPSVDFESLISEREEMLNEGKPLIVANEEASVEWSFADRVTPEGFTPEAVITLLNDKEVSVDFAYSGELPEGTQVTIYIPEEATYFFNDGDGLYLYYNNPETGLREYVGEGVCDYIGDGTSGKMLATFDIHHCSEYIITYEYQGDAYVEIDMGVPIEFYIFVAVGVLLCSVVGVLVYLRIKKQKKLVPADIWYDPTLKIDKFRG